MAELPNPFSCDVCGVHKGENNHWWRIWQGEKYGVVITPWDRLVPLKHQHACGEEHALRLAAKLLGEITPQAQPQWDPNGPILTEEPKTND